MVVFRMRLLPTIYSSHQFIDHQGVLVNNKLITIPSYKVKIGDIVSIPKKV
jgi:small subunit ribosomal protein S4